MLSFKRSVTRFVPARLNVCEWLRPNFQQLAKVNGCHLPAQAIRSADAYPADAHCVLLTQAQQAPRFSCRRVHFGYEKREARVAILAKRIGAPG